VFVTDNQIEAMTMADRLVVRDQGRLEQFGTSLEIYYCPATQFVASFIGSPPMNFLSPSLLPIPLSEGTVTVGIRPEHLTAEGAQTPCWTLSVN
jgi:sn-glycerol 3-phosphate transport system ATP-binding protein